MPIEPFYIVQTAEPLTVDERHEWLSLRHTEGVARGAKFFRASFEPDMGIVLLEGWLDRPEDQGEPRFQITAK